MDQFLDFRRGDRIEGRARLIHQDHFRFHRKRAGNAEPMLLATGKTGAWLVRIVLYFVPQSCHAQRFFDSFIKEFLIATPRSGAEADDEHFRWIVMVGNGLDFWKIMPTRRRIIVGSTPAWNKGPRHRKEPPLPSAFLAPDHASD